MDRDRLVLGLASVFAGLTVLLTVVAMAEQPFLLVVALPFGAVTYFMWYHASGRLDARVRRRAARGEARRSPNRGGFGAGARREAARDSRRAREARDRARGRGRGRRRGGGRDRRREASAGAAAADPDRPTRAEAYGTLDLDPDADEAAVKRAYREKVKEVHPDTEGGDEEAFKRVNRAYERLSN